MYLLKHSGEDNRYERLDITLVVILLGKADEQRSNLLANR